MQVKTMTHNWFKVDSDLWEVAPSVKWWWQSALLLLQIYSRDCGLMKPELRQSCPVCSDNNLLGMPAVTLYFYEISAVIVRSTEEDGTWCLGPAVSSELMGTLDHPENKNTLHSKTKNSSTVPWRNESSCFYQSSVILTFFNCRNEVSHLTAQLAIHKIH